MKIMVQQKMMLPQEAKLRKLYVCFYYDSGFGYSIYN